MAGAIGSSMSKSGSPPKARPSPYSRHIQSKIVQSSRLTGVVKPSNRFPRTRRKPKLIGPARPLHYMRGIGAH